MSGLLITTVASGATAFFLVALFAIERRRGHRFAAGPRRQFDRTLTVLGGSIRAKASQINQLFFRELLHYIAHLALSFVLIIVRGVERLVMRVSHVNRSKAQSLRRLAYRDKHHPPIVPTSPHFSAIADHKRSVELTEEEKRMRKKQALRKGM